MGVEYVNAPHFDIRKSFEESNILTPLIFILSPGIDPTEILLQFAQRLGYAQSFQTIAMGPGQQPMAEKLIEQAQVQGAWICLQNCHMSIDWLTQLESIWEGMSIYNTTCKSQSKIVRQWLRNNCLPIFLHSVISSMVDNSKFRPISSRTPAKWYQIGVRAAERIPKQFTTLVQIATNQFIIVLRWLRRQRQVISTFNLFSVLFRCGPAGAKTLR